MNKYLVIISSFFLVTTITGCTTIYKTVVDERNVKTIARDTKIKGKILAKFIDDKTIKALDISVACYEGRVYLIGEYETIEQRELSIEIARNTEGVKNISTYLLPKKKDPPCSTKENIKITAKVKVKLVGDKNIWSTNIDIKTIQCIVVLWGLVGSNEEIRKSIAHGRSVEGVKSVKSFLRTSK